MDGRSLEITLPIIEQQAAEEPIPVPDSPTQSGSGWHQELDAMLDRLDLESTEADVEATSDTAPSSSTPTPTLTSESTSIPTPTSGTPASVMIYKQKTADVSMPDRWVLPVILSSQTSTSTDRKIDQ